MWGVVGSLWWACFITPYNFSSVSNSTIIAEMYFSPIFQEPFLPQCHQGFLDIVEWGISNCTFCFNFGFFSLFPSATPYYYIKREGASSQIFSGPDWWFASVGQSNDPMLGKHRSLPFPPATSVVSVSDPWKGFFGLIQCPSRHSSPRTPSRTTDPNLDCAFAWKQKVSHWSQNCGGGVCPLSNHPLHYR